MIQIKNSEFTLEYAKTSQIIFEVFLEQFKRGDKTEVQKENI